MEERYPQVCEECEPRVRERIQKTGYAAKTDHLRRMMERTRGTTIMQTRWDWRYIVVYAGALSWWASFIGQMLWDAMGAMATSSDGLGEVNDVCSLMCCLRKGVQEQMVDQSCVEASQPLASLALVLGFLSIWWNPRLSSKLRGPKGRMVGLSDFYKLQFINMGIRSAALYLLQHRTTSPLDQQFAKASHAIMFVFTFAVSSNILYPFYISDFACRLQFCRTLPSKWTTLLVSYSQTALNLSKVNIVIVLGKIKIKCREKILNSEWVHLTPDHRLLLKNSQ